MQEAWFPLAEGFEFAASVEEGRERGTARIAERAQCEMIMMIGLPGSGKTTWVTDHVEKNPEKRYNVIGTSALIERMKVCTLIFITLLSFLSCSLHAII